MFYVTLKKHFYQGKNLPGRLGVSGHKKATGVGAGGPLGMTAIE
jgi:hypothetical protein